MRRTMPPPAPMLAAALLAAPLLAGPPAGAQIRNAPAPRALEFSAYIFAAANVCGYRIGTPSFEALLARQGARIDDVQPRGPFGNRVQTMFALMSNQMALDRDRACAAVAGEYGPEGSIARDVLLPAAVESGAPAGAPQPGGPADPPPAAQPAAPAR